MLTDVQQHQLDSKTYLSKIRSTWDDKEAMLIGILRDGMSSKTASQVNDPRLSTIVFERAARVTAKLPTGIARARSKNDVAKNILMNKTLAYYRGEANEQFKMLIKLRLWDLYSLVYGSMFALVPWRITDNYQGPELLIQNIRDCYPQSGGQPVDDADWFSIRNYVSKQFLEQQPEDFWFKDNINALLSQIPEDPGDLARAKDSEDITLVEQDRYPSVAPDRVDPQYELITEYRGDKWITWTPRRVDEKTSKPFILRVVENPYPDGMLPVVAKHAFPLLDAPIGLGEFERGQSLQLAMNSLINVHLDGVKSTIRPPLSVNPRNVVASSLKWGAGVRWFMNNPGKDVVPLETNPRGLDTFNSTYGFLLSALLNQSGTTDVSKGTDQESSLGKTPQAIKKITDVENSRDDWDRIMMESSMEQVDKRWVALIAENMDEDVEMRLFGDEIKDLQNIYPGEIEIFDSGITGNVKVSNKFFKEKNEDGSESSTKFDYDLESGSMSKETSAADRDTITEIMKAVLENPQINESLAQDGKKVNLGFLFKQWVEKGGVKDTNKVIVDIAQPGAEAPQGVPGAAVPPGIPVEGAAPPVPGVPPVPVAPGTPQVPGVEPVPPEQVVQAAPEGAGTIKDPELAQLLQQAEAIGGVPGIPAA